MPAMLIKYLLWVILIFGALTCLFMDVVRSFISITAPFNLGIGTAVIYGSIYYKRYLLLKLQGTLLIFCWVPGTTLIKKLVLERAILYGGLWEEKSFISKIKECFGYLESEYGFRVIYEKDSDIRPQTDGMVEYISNSTGVIIDSETGYATVHFYRIRDGKKYYLTPVDIYEYLNTSDKEKDLLLSTNPSDRSAASTLFNEKLLLNRPGWKGSHGTVDDLDRELINFSNWLKEHAGFCIEGDFSRWPFFYEYKVNRARADHMRRGKDELGYVRVKDPNGNWRLIEQSIFKDELEYVDQLKKEFSS